MQIGGLFDTESKHAKSFAYRLAEEIKMELNAAELDSVNVCGRARTERDESRATCGKRKRIEAAAIGFS